MCVAGRRKRCARLLGGILRGNGRRGRIGWRVVRRRLLPREFSVLVFSWSGVVNCEQLKTYENMHLA